MSHFDKIKNDYRHYLELLKKYQEPDALSSVWQVFNSFIPYYILLGLMFLSIEYSYFVTLLLAIPTVGFLTRIFIIQHDCGHGSFTKNQKLNDWIGRCASIITWTPYQYWRKSHALHHARSGNLEKRGIGDIYTMTVKEYLDKSAWGRFKYRFYRNPIVLFLIGAPLLFIVFQRFPTSTMPEMKREYKSIWTSNIVLAVYLGFFSYLFGWETVLLIHLPIIILASSLGVWLFYVQHQFEHMYWEDNSKWNYVKAAIEGCSFYKLPKIFQWFTGNIGFHHIHHLSPKIPNYHLEKAHKENTFSSLVTVLTVKTSLQSLFLKLWDEEERRMVNFRYLKYKKYLIKG